MFGLLLLGGAVARAQPTAAPASPEAVAAAVEPAALGYREALVLGLVEGITEYLPISSTGHLLLTNELLCLNDPAPVLGADGRPVTDREGVAFSLKRAADAYAIMIQAGAILAVVVLYWSRLWTVAMGLLGRDPRGLRLGLNLLVAFLPAACLGLLLDSWIESLLFFPGPIAIALLFGAFLMWGVEFWRRRAGREDDAGPDLPELTYRQSLLIGFLQCVAMWPGTSRSMMTIVGGYLVGLSPRRAAEFSFLLGFITLSAAAAYKTFKDGREVIQVIDLGPLLLGTLVAFLAAVLAIRWLIGYLTRHGLGIFAWYRVVLAILVFVFLSDGQIWPDA